jgi:hypothetical protein
VTRYDSRKCGGGGGNTGRQREELLHDEVPIRGLRGEIRARRHNKHDENHVKEGNYQPFSRPDPRARQWPYGPAVRDQTSYELVGMHAEILCQARCLIRALISAGDAKNTDARSPIMPVGRMTGLPLSGPVLLESILKRRLASQKSVLRPSAVVTL